MFCVIVIPAIDGLVTPHVQERIRLHEIGHCAGWPRIIQEPAGKISPQPIQQPHRPQAKFVLSATPAAASPSRMLPGRGDRVPAVVLYEEDPNDPLQRQRITGTVVWQAGMMAPRRAIRLR